MPTDQYLQNWIEARAHAEAAGHTIVEIGWEQHVIIDEPNGIVYRYPRHAAAAAKLDDEVAVLHRVHERTWPIDLPFMRQHTPVYTAYDYIPGEVLTPERVDGLQPDDFEQIGEALGGFLAQFHKLDSTIVDQKKTRHTTSLIEYYARRIEGAKGTDFYEKASQALEQLLSHGESEAVVVHGDLHGPNVVIDPIAKKLVGVIDLSEMEVGDPHQEFRKIFMTFPAALRATMTSYERNGGQRLDEEKLILWAYVNEWANVCHFATETHNLTYQRAFDHLSKWHQI